MNTLAAALGLYLLLLAAGYVSVAVLAQATDWDTRASAIERGLTERIEQRTLRACTGY